MTIKENFEAFERIVNLLKALVNHSVSTPVECLEWRETADLLTAVEQFDKVGYF
jgi:putative ATP-dependent endonuclease of OLD family